MPQKTERESFVKEKKRRKRFSQANLSIKWKTETAEKEVPFLHLPWVGLYNVGFGCASRTMEGSAFFCFCTEKGVLLPTNQISHSTKEKRKSAIQSGALHAYPGRSLWIW